MEVESRVHVDYGFLVLGYMLWEKRRTSGERSQDTLEATVASEYPLGLYIEFYKNALVYIHIACLLHRSACSSWRDRMTNLTYP
jgi:hypothetical protein